MEIMVEKTTSATPEQIWPYLADPATYADWWADWHSAVTDAHVARMEAAVEEFNAGLKPLKEFILPGGTRAAALAHVARTVCRRAERAIVRLAAHETVSDPARRYLNRLSDLLFVMARGLNHAAGRPDVLWRHDRGAARGKS